MKRSSSATSGTRSFIVARSDGLNGGLVTGIGNSGG